MRSAAVLLLAVSMARAADPPRPIRVMLDPGHGGEHVGALGPKEPMPKKGQKPLPRLMEKNVVLTLAKLVGERLKALGINIGYTRTTDTMVPLLDRAIAANEEGADIFVSIHLNACTSKSAKGSEVYFMSLGPVDKDTQDLADADNEPENTSKEPDYLTAILEDMAQAAFLHESECLAVCIQAELNYLAGIKERGVKQAPFAVLRTAAMPAVLVEVAFISNPEEAAKLRNPIFLKSAANAIAKGIQCYIESSGNSGGNRAWRRPIL